jgi:adenylate cyclase class 1
MGKNIHKDSGKIFWNRQAFLRFNQFRLNRTYQSLSSRDRLVFLVIPRLLHVNQEGLPGYFREDVPCGIHNFNLDRESQIAAETMFPNMILRRNEKFDPIIHTMLIMGSIGSIAQTQKSDLDYTLIVNKPTLTDTTLALLRRKLDLIEEWTWTEYHLETHFFINDYNEFRENRFGESDSESTGSAQAKLLKEEMFRTMIILAGKIPFWWIVPMQTEDDHYERLLQLVNSSQTLLNREDFLDLGNVDDISEGEFFGGSIWALIKSFKSPFKTLLKMGLLENYMFGETKSSLLCHEIKHTVLTNKSFEDIDPYISLFNRVQNFFSETKPQEDLEVLRAAFYLKVGTQVSPKEIEEGSTNYKKRTLINMIKQWGWSHEQLEHYNQFDSWQMKQKVALGSQVNKILMSSYRNISEKNKTLSKEESLITEQDTHLLGRKLFSFYRKAPNKVENLVTIVDGNTAEKELTFIATFDHHEKPTWYLVRGKELNFLEYIPTDSIIKKSATLPFLIAFAGFNRLFLSQTQIWIKSGGHSIREHDLRVLLNQLTNFSSQIDITSISNKDLIAEEVINSLYMIIDFGTPLPREVTIGNINRCKTAEELQRFLDRRLERIKYLSCIYLTSWGELFCKTFSGMDCMSRCLNEISPQLKMESLKQSNFLKIYIPSGRREILQIPWLNNYILRSLNKRGQEAHSPQADKL